MTEPPSVEKSPPTKTGPLPLTWMAATRPFGCGFQPSTAPVVPPHRREVGPIDATPTVVKLPPM